ncbi:MAG: hypothetical protein HY076_04365 [Candidatus Eisenbacteria bacterium]|uniref:Uncharacterized protein n=1 Tax=Eiseniibacteriota bacterium TaxID=2212470 RepID=A0A9D6L5W7_UNCEI|nr:hypothetical protein [Candidatus Eisenbacteria bacterium]MBI3539488.1 hypothetical protein [Candidatus Eisenbacteria bacterium]
MHAARSLALIAALALTASAAHAAAPRAAATHAAVTAHEPKYVVPWIADDYARALAEARARHVPIFIEAWAPW